MRKNKKKIKKTEEMKKRSCTQESKTELFFLAKIFFLILQRKCSSFSSSCTEERRVFCRREYRAERGMCEEVEEEVEEVELNASVKNERVHHFLFLAKMIFFFLAEMHSGNSLRE